jgi:hypothetical protein
VLVVLPSFSLGESLLSHYAARIPALEHRYLLPIPMLGRIRGCEMVFVCSEAPADVVLDYYFELVPASLRDDAPPLPGSGDPRRHRARGRGEAS